MELSYSILYLLIFLVAFLYASVGHGGASGYLALMALYGFAPDEMKPTALVLNIFVSLMAFIQYYRRGFFNKNIFIPLAIASVPLAFLGGLTPVEDEAYRKILGVLLLIPAIRFLGFFPVNEKEFADIKILPLLLIGGVIGYISGLTGIGGGVILSPLLLMLGWTNMKQTAALSAPFILVNSISGLGGNVLKGIHFDESMMSWVAVALIGGFIGAYAGANKFNNLVLSKVLATVLIIASLKLLFS